MRYFLMRWGGEWRSETQMRDYHAEHVRDLMSFEEWIQRQCQPGNMILKIQEVA